MLACLGGGLLLIALAAAFSSGGTGNPYQDGKQWEEAWQQAQGGGTGRIIGGRAQAIDFCTRIANDTGNNGGQGYAEAGSPTVPSSDSGVQQWIQGCADVTHTTDNTPTTDITPTTDYTPTTDNSTDPASSVTASPTDSPSDPSGQPSPAQPSPTAPLARLVVVSAIPLRFNHQNILHTSADPLSKDNWVTSAAEVTMEAKGGTVIWTFISDQNFDVQNFDVYTLSGNAPDSQIVSTMSSGTLSAGQKVTILIGTVCGSAKGDFVITSTDEQRNVLADVTIPYTVAPCHAS